MAQHTQFAEIFSQRAAALAGHAPASPRQRWVIWLRQAEEEHRVCFATSARDTCREAGCPHRAECINLRAEWLR